MLATHPDARLRASSGDNPGSRPLSGALQIDPQHGPTHQALADYYEKAGQPELAARPPGTKKNRLAGGFPRQVGEI